MQNTNYKVVTFGNNIYREQVLTPEERDIVKIGTTKNCQIRFNKDRFFSEFEISLVRVGALWRVVSDEHVYFTTDGIMKIYSKDLEHGDEITVKYRNVNVEIFKFNFFINFDDFETNYDRVIDISDKGKLLIGGKESNDIYIHDSLLGSDSITLEKNPGGYLITDNNTRYGVYVNGQKINGYCKLKDYDFFMIVGFSFYLKDNKLYTSIAKNIIVNNTLSEDYPIKQGSVYVYPKFNRNTRIKYKRPDTEIEILPPAPKIQKTRTNIILVLAPALAMLFISVFLRGSMGGNSSYIVYIAASMSIGIIVSIATYIIDRNRYKKDVKERSEKYLEYITRKEEEVKALREKELSVLNITFAAMAVNIKNALEFTRNIFEKDVKDEDFLLVRIGTGDVVSSSPIKYTKQEFKETDDNLVDLPEQLEVKYHSISDAPIVSMVSKCNAIGIIGKSIKEYEVLKNITLDIVIRHFYKDVKLFYIFNSEDSEKISWIRWLGHIQNDALGLRNLIYDEESKNVLLEYLYKELSRRENELKQQNDDVKLIPYIVVFIFDKSVIERHPVSKYFEECSQLGFTFIFFEENADLLPKGCNEIIEIDECENKGQLILSADGDSISKFNYDIVPDNIAHEIALKLSPIFVDEVSLESQLTKNISLFELLGILSVEDLDIEQRWTNSKVYASLAAPLGIKANKQIVYLDLNEKYHGPHGLVAGTTGSGKSEILQSYILSMASLFHPYEIGFVIIDFKGGGMANQFKMLPHLIGTITNIDGREINRSLLSIKAELRHRQAIFSQYNVNHIDSYIKLYKEKKADMPLPHLIIIVDEFAELKSEYPDFMKELISAARIGRSLGVHLILATQKPSGVVDNQIWSNSKFKLCLKVQTKEDSNEVIKTPLAAEIVEPGRAYLQVGNNEIFELFQSAYSGAKVLNIIGEKNIEFEINEINLWGKRKTVFSNKQKKEDKDAQTQLDAVVEYIGNYCIENNIIRLPGICLPPLSDVIYYDELNSKKNISDEAIYTTIGIYDDPEQQLQSELVIDLSISNVFIAGASQMGKTTLLQSIIYDSINSYSPKDVNIYAIDCGNMALKVFEKSNHVGGVVNPSEDERIANLFKMINREIETRKSLFSEKGLGTFAAYKEAKLSSIPQIFLIIDNYIAFKEFYSDYEPQILMYSREGPGVGINLIITGNQTNALGYKLLTNFATRIALSCNEKSEYSNLFDRCRVEPKTVPGRGLIVIDKRIVEFQTALCVKAEKEIERVGQMKELIANINSNYSIKAKPIPMVPVQLLATEVFDNNRVEYTNKYSIPIGMDYSSVSFRCLDLLTIGVLVITGREKSGKTNLINHLMWSLNKTIFNNMTEAYIIDSQDQQLKKTKEYGFTKRYTVDLGDMPEMLEEIANELEKRLLHISEGGNLDKYPLQLLIIENSDFITAISKDKDCYATFNKITKQYKNLKVAVIFSNIENVAAGYNAPDLLKFFKENRKFIIFEDLQNLKLADTTLKQQKEFSKPIKIGDGYLYFNGEIEKIKTIKSI